MKPQGYAATTHISRFSVTRGQYVIGFAALIALLGIGVTTLAQSQNTIAQAKMLSDVETPAASIIFTQRETLVYATRLAQWSNGGAPRRQVQIARNLLAQRLAVIDGSGKSMGSRANYAYWKALRASDEIVANSVPGILPENLHEKVSAELSPVIDEILAAARNLVVSYQRSVDREMALDAQRTADGNQRQLLFFYIFILLSGLFLTLNVRSNFRNYRETRRIIEQEQVKLEETLAELKAAQGEVTKLQDLDQAKNAFISTVNHELRTPLTSIIGYIEVIREELESTTDEQMRKYLEVLDRNAQILLNLVESMLSLSKIDSLEGKLSVAKVSLTQVLDNAIFVMQPNSERSNISISFNFDESADYYVQGDAGQLSQVFVNLIGNAIKFSPQSSAISISMRHEDGDGLPAIVVEVADSGIGIPQEDLDNLFQRFFRASNAVSEHFQGTGLGLSIVDQSVQLHGGSIKVTSQIGAGTTFSVTLPRYLEEEDTLISSRREGVLVRAINSLQIATPETLKAITHEVGGAIGFYGFEEEGRAILELSRAINDQPTSLHLKRRDEFVEFLQNRLAVINGGFHE